MADPLRRERHREQCPVQSGAQVRPPWVERHTKEAQRRKYESALARHPRLLWIPYALPVFPIDVISALLGVSGLRRRWFLLITLFALPSYTGITALVGSRFGRYVPWINGISLAILVLLAGWLLFFVLSGLVRRRRGRQSERSH